MKHKSTQYLILGIFVNDQLTKEKLALAGFNSILDSLIYSNFIGYLAFSTYVTKINRYFFLNLSKKSQLKLVKS